MTTVTITADRCQCAICGAHTRCLVVTAADDVDDLSRSALTLRKTHAAVCQPCITRALLPRHHGRHRWADRPES